MIFSLKAYPKYRESSVEWMCKIPERWSIVKLRHVSQLIVSNVDKHTFADEVPIRLCNYVDVYKNDYISSNMNFMEGTATESEISKFRINIGDVIITKDSEDWQDIGVPALVKYEAPDLVCGYHLAILRPDTSQIIGEYLLRVLQNRNIAAQFHVDANGITRYGLSHQSIKNILLPIPPLEDQQAIAKFLTLIDRHIKRLIRAKRHLIELLNEQKQAIIHRAVTRGLDKNVSLKPSGINWIGEIPEHWQISKLKNISNLILSTVDKKVVQGENPVRLCNYLDVYNNEYISSDLDYMAATATESEIEKFKLRIDDVIITKDSEDWKDIGVPSLVTYEARDFICGYHLAILRPISEKIQGEYLLRSLQDRLIASQLHIAANGITRHGLSQQSIKDLMLPVPPLNEQNSIIEVLSRDLQLANRAISRLFREIDLLREYRARLIADVVTGKLDVRGVDIPKFDEAAFLDELDSGEEMDLAEDEALEAAIDAAD